MFVSNLYYEWTTKEENPIFLYFGSLQIQLKSGKNANSDFITFDAFNLAHTSFFPENHNYG